MDQSPSGAAVAVGEGVDGLELGVGDAGLDEGGQVVGVGEGDQVVHEGGAPTSAGGGTKSAPQGL